MRADTEMFARKKHGAFQGELTTGFACLLPHAAIGREVLRVTAKFAYLQDVSWTRGLSRNDAVTLTDAPTKGTGFARKRWMDCQGH